MICTTQRKLVSSHIKGDIFNWLLILVLLLENIFIPKTEENVFFVFFFFLHCFIVVFAIG